MTDGAFRSSSFLRDPSRLTLVGGKGGVGKTTTAAAIAIALGDAGFGVLVLSVDPAHSLGDALAVRLGPDPMPLPGVARVAALEIDPELERRRFLATHRGALLALLERGTYLDAADAEGLVDLTVPGLDELAALFRLRELLRTERLLVVDTAPTGHTLRLLELPELARAWLGALRAMEDRSRAVSTALVGAYRADEASAMLVELDRDLASLSRQLRAPGRTRFVLVTGREPVVLAETLRYHDELVRRGFSIGAVVVNRSTRAAVENGWHDRMIFVPTLDREPVGADALRRFAAHLLGEAPVPFAPDPPTPTRLVVAGPFVPPGDRQLYVVAGKGGVGKSTSAASLAIRLAGSGRSVLLLGADPAGSLGDVLELPVGTGVVAVPAAGALQVRQLQAESIWEEFRAGYQADAERLFGSLIGTRGTGSDLDVVQRLVGLAPPGLDELAALMEVVDLTEDRPYDAVVLDTAPTGHFLRLLELPGLALAWAHQVMRLLLKYREVVAAGELGERLLKLTRTLRSFQERLRDPARCWTLVVALPEALGAPETERLLAGLEQLRIRPGALMLNRLIHDGEIGRRGERAVAALTAAAGEIPLLAAPDVESDPRGVENLATFAASWRMLRRLDP